jgi:hypothetical protein
LHDANHDGFFEIGSAPGGDAEIDLDALFTTAIPAQSIFFDALQMLDDPADEPTCTSTAGADIDAVMALVPQMSATSSTWGQVKTLYRE